MKIDELKKIAEENDYEFYESLEYKTITLTREISVDGFITNHITINSKTENQVFIGNGHCDEKDLNMIKAAVKFAETPPEDRGEEKKFYLEHKYLRSVRGSMLYFTIYISHDLLLVKSRIVSENLKQKFTLKEIEEIKEKYDTDLADFELVEVEDVD